jgi:hypothetical protein
LAEFILFNLFNKENWFLIIIQIIFSGYISKY